jgi:diguanylate cyclase (GGDEF)-like protein
LKYKGRIISQITLFLTVAVWHSSYFFLDREASYEFFITDGFLIYDFIYTPLLIPVVWWLGTQYDKVNYYSEKDILTGAYNRRYVLGIFPKLTAFMDRSMKKICLSIVDIDNFKSINDTYGHDVGDKVLQHVSRILTENTRNSDIIARWGGDEFLVVASADDTGIQRINTRLEYKLNECSVHREITIAISIGTAVYPEDAGNLHDLIKVADAKMYGIKLNRPEDVPLPFGFGFSSNG